MRALRLFLLVAVMGVANTAAADSPAPNAPSSTTTPAASKTPVAASAQGVAVIGTAGTREDAFLLARAVYGSTLRPRQLDELQARILAGDPALPNAARETKELAELRAGVTGEDAASRRLLTTIGEQLGVRAILVVSGTGSTTSGATVASPTATADADAGASDAGAATATVEPVGTSADGGTTPVDKRGLGARLFLVDTAEFDAARYEPEVLAEGGVTWRGTVASLIGRFPPPPTMTAQLATPPTLPSNGGSSTPFYLSPWLWGAVGAAALIGGVFFLATRDSSSSDPVHLQMNVPR